MYDFQDTTTGMWGPKNRRNHKLMYLDLNNTKSIVKNFRDKSGNNLHKEFPLKYGNKLFKTSVNQLSESYPDEDDLDKIHEWNLRQAKGLSMLLEYLWVDATNEDKKNIKKVIAKNIDICFENYYVKEDGAFSFYPDSKTASPDGISNLVFKEIGAFSYEKQKKLWGDPLENIKYFYEYQVSDIDGLNLEPILNIADINSLRIYSCSPDYVNLTDNVWAIYYPKNTPVLDVAELVPNIVNWAETSSLSIGNWTSMASIHNKYSHFNMEKPEILKSEYFIEEINEKLKESSELYIIGFDKLQIPRCKIDYKLL
jgi:hypothetical protein